VPRIQQEPGTRLNDDGEPQIIQAPPEGIQLAGQILTEGIQVVVI
jgi:hypothetical protein